MKHPLQPHTLEALFISLVPGEELALHRSTEDDVIGVISATNSDLTVSRKFDFAHELERDVPSALWEQAQLTLKALRKVEED